MKVTYRLSGHANATIELTADSAGELRRQLDALAGWICTNGAVFLEVPRGAHRWRYITGFLTADRAWLLARIAERVERWHQDAARMSCGA